MRAATDFAQDGAGWRFVRLVADEGSASDPMLNRGVTNLRSLSPALVSDIAHHLCVMHGRFPGLVDHAANHTADPEARDWLIESTGAFAAERRFLTHLTVSTGPVVSSATDENCAQAFAAQSHAFEMLGTSDRQGCAVGAAVAFIEDWLVVRNLLDAIAMKVGIDTPPNSFPSSEQNRMLVETLASKSVSIERAMFFGIDQLLTQQRAFWKLLSARAESRSRD